MKVYSSLISFVNNLSMEEMNKLAKVGPGAYYANPNTFENLVFNIFDLMQQFYINKDTASNSDLLIEIISHLLSKLIGC